MYIRPFSSVSYKDIALVGGKAASLGELLRHRISVPDGFVITTNAYTAFKDHMSDEFNTLLHQAFEDLGATRVAVRSSAVGEDSDDASWAGQLETYLNTTEDTLVQAVRDCWQSATSDRAKSYATQQGITKDLPVAVVVQRMVDSDTAGVAFSSNPVTGGDSEIFIEAIHGLGVLLVQGSVIPDSYVIDKQSGALLDYSANKQTQKLVYLSGHTQTVAQIPGVRCLTDKQLADLCRLVQKIEQHYGKPQDVEWALQHDKLFIVQARPITT